MDAQWLLTTLRLARDELEELIASVEASREPSEAEADARVQVSQVYIALNYAWNTRNGEAAIGPAHDKAIRIPTDLDL